MTPPVERTGGTPVGRAAASRARILVVDDDESLRRELGHALELEGYRVARARNGAEALAFFDGRHDPPELVVLDILMPELDGIATSRLIRKRSAAPILMLTARDEVGDRVAGLEAGADDYLGKPFAVAELLARVGALLRRAPAAAKTLRYSDLELDLTQRIARRGSRTISLTRIEFALLEVFLRKQRLALDRSELFLRVWGYEAEHSSNSLDVFISSLRCKTEAGGEPRLIQTIRGVGFALREEV